MCLVLALLPLYSVEHVGKKICKQPVHESSCAVSVVHKDSLVILHGTALCRCA